MNTRTILAPFRVFVYGTLKRGFSNHDYFCRGITAIEEAVICGQLYALNDYIPTLAIPEASILARGSLTYADDQQHQLNASIDQEPLVATDVWRMIHGEVLTFPENERLARLDQLEGFHPPGPCLYHRVLAPVRLQGGEWLASWVYITGDRGYRHMEPLEGNVWENGKASSS